jgi:hypothetical protein
LTRHGQQDGKHGGASGSRHARRAAIAAGIDAFANAYSADEPQSRMREFLDAQAELKARA